MHILIAFSAHAALLPPSRGYHPATRRSACHTAVACTARAESSSARWQRRSAQRTQTGCEIEICSRRLPTNSASDGQIGAGNCISLGSAALERIFGLFFLVGNLNRGCYTTVLMRPGHPTPERAFCHVITAHVFFFVIVFLTTWTQS